LTRANGLIRRLPGVATAAANKIPVVESMCSGLFRYGVGNENLSGLRLNAMACVALPTCALAMAESERYLPSLVDKIDVILDDCKIRDEPITIRMSGCPNSCSRPTMAEIAFVGKAPGLYNM
jgi:sulfite reductase (NADPH) hemoprotein beta-component